MTLADIPADTSTESEVAAVFNSTVAGFAIATAWQLGALDQLREDRRLDAAEFAERMDLDPASTRSLFAALSAAGVVERDGDEVCPGRLFEETFSAKAFFHWLTIGCAELFADMPNVMRRENRKGRFYRRDAAAIGYACRDINRLAFDPAFRTALDSLDFTVTGFADLGCGSGGRIAELAGRYPKAHGVGVDIAPAALRDAEEFVAEQGYGERVSFVSADVCRLPPDQRFDQVDLITCFMMGHDFWPREECVATLRQLRESFPNARRFLLGDTARTQGIPDHSMPVFNLAFEVAHDLMGAYLPSLQEWDGVFAEGGWKCERVHQVRVPKDSVIFELTPAASEGYDSGA